MITTFTQDLTKDFWYPSHKIFYMNKNIFKSWDSIIYSFKFKSSKNPSLLNQKWEKQSEKSITQDIVWLVNDPKSQHKIKILYTQPMWLHLAFRLLSICSINGVPVYLPIRNFFSEWFFYFLVSQAIDKWVQHGNQVFV